MHEERAESPVALARGATRCRDFSGIERLQVSASAEAPDSVRARLLLEAMSQQRGGS